MATDKPLISILMAVYEPRMDWLKEQLDSLNTQSYSNLRLYVRDDCSPTVPFEEVVRLVQGCITAFPYSIERNERNLGSNGTFELLTREAEGEYFAYCDQDDVWLPEKLAVLRETIEREQAGLACSDVIVMDKHGTKVADSITTIRPRHVFKQGKGLAKDLIYRNFVIGCTMLVRREIAQGAIPFAKSMVHDHFIAFCCEMGNGIAIADRPLVRYRQHNANQTGVLSHIVTKTDYIEKHIKPFYERVKELQQRFPSKDLREAEQWAQARKLNALRLPGGMRQLFARRKINQTTTIFELLALRFPAPLFRVVIQAIQKGIL